MHKWHGVRRLCRAILRAMPHLFLITNPIPDLQLKGASSALQASTQPTDLAKKLSKEHVLKALEPLLETLRDEEGKKNNPIETELSKYKNDIRSTRSAISDSNNG